jgi:hypothetical protein
MSGERDATLRPMNAYCYRVDAGDLAGFAAPFAHGTLRVRGDPAGEASGAAAVAAWLGNVTPYAGKPNTS